jgi:hypothetical protein
MANISVTHTFSNGSVIDAGEVNQNFTDIINGTSDGTKDLSINALTVAGALTANGAVTLGNATGDDITVTGSLASTVNIKTTYSYDVGSSTIGLKILYFGSDDSSANTVGLLGGTHSSSYTLKLPDADGAAKDYLQTDGSGQLAFVGGAAPVSKDNTYTATTGDKVIPVDTNTNGAWTLTLYAASGNAGRILKVIKTTSDFNSLTIDGNGSETINGATTMTLDVQYEAVTIMCDGSNWFILEHYIPTISGKFTGTKSTAITNGNVFFLAYDATSFNNNLTFTAGTAHDTTNNNNGAKCVVNKAGVHRVRATCYPDSSAIWDANETMEVLIYVNGSAVAEEYITGQGSSITGDSTNRAADLLNLSKLDRVEIGFRQNTGSSIAMVAASDDLRNIWTIDYVGV